MSVSNLYSDGANINVDKVKTFTLVNNGASQKDILKNTDANNASDVIAKNKDKQNTKIIDFSVFSSEDVSAYIVFKRFEYKRGRQDSHKDFVPDDSSWDITNLIGAIGNSISSNRTWDSTDYKGAIVLPLQSPVLLEHNVMWDNFTSLLTNAGATIATIGAQAFGSALIKGAAGRVVANGIIKRADMLQNAGGSMLAGSAAALGQYAANVTANELGTIFNPDTELVLQGIGMRRHSFEFTLTPRNQQEQQMIKDAIRTFKLGMLPSKSGAKLNGSSTNLSYPDEWVIHFIDGRHSKIGQPLAIPHIPDCALTNVAVMYNPQGHRFHIDGSPVQYRISLMFEEHTTLTGDDIESGNY